MSLILISVRSRSRGSLATSTPGSLPRLRATSTPTPKPCCTDIEPGHVFLSSAAEERDVRPTRLSGTARSAMTGHQIGCRHDAAAASPVSTCRRYRQRKQTAGDTCGRRRTVYNLCPPRLQHGNNMIRLVLSCLALSAALAKPPPKAVYGEAPEISPRLKSDSEPQPLPAPDAKERASYTLAAGSYYITSPNYPRYYPNGASVSYTLQGREGQLLSISCQSFNIESHSSCAYDFLAVNGERFCGSTGPDVSDTTLEIIFSSDGSVRRRGFYCIISVPNGGGTTAATTAATTASPENPSDGQCCGVANRASRIVGGVQTEVNEYPWQAGIVNTGGTRTWCGGTVINNRYVLTAAHCTAGQSASRIQVLLREHRIGTSDGEMRFSVERIIDHPSYTSASGSGYDFSLLKLSSTIDFSSLDNKVAPACLPTGGDFANVDAIVSGWGTTSSGGSQATSLREVTVQTMTNSECRQSYGSTINNSMLCAGVDGGGKDSCQGDSGGPLVTDVSGRYTLIGVVSWGAGCGDAGFPGVYARVTEVTSWIEQNTADASLC